ncbi:MAG: endonuclease III domain-containing protein, partial [Candidatus Omnitrophica bacterium]|nr:endonuclease III domain-containing protein [Candidatus Omnitrophota bacterium]
MKPGFISIYRKLFARFGPQHWWPADTPLEVMVGAILTQNTNWGNVEKAVGNLKRHKVLTFPGLHGLSRAKLASLIRPAGYYNIKSGRLKNFIDFFVKEYRGNIHETLSVETPRLREQLLSVNGIGPETADSILLYALGRPVFGVDAYTRRILSRHGMAGINDDYAEVQNLFMRNLDPDAQMFNE